MQIITSVYVSINLLNGLVTDQPTGDIWGYWDEENNEFHMRGIWRPIWLPRRELVRSVIVAVAAGEGATSAPGARWGRIPEKRGAN